MKKRTLIELLVVVVLIGLAVVSLQPARQTSARYTLDHGRISYNGGLLKHKFNGHGRLTFKNHDQYIGDFKAGQFAGKGTFISHENWRYQGTFVAGVPDGQGTLTIKKHVYHGVFRKGVLTHAN